MSSILLLTFIFQIFAIFWQKNNFQNIRRSLLNSIVVFSIFVFASTEILSLFSALNSNIVFFWWLTANIVLGCYLIFVSKIYSTFNFLVFSSKKDWFSTPTKIFLWILFSAIFVSVYVTALTFPPNTVDALTYHLPRVAHWVQAGSVEFYTTPIDRQLYNSPLAEFAILHLQLLVGNDSQVNLVQFFGFAAAGIVGSLIAKRLGLKELSQLVTIFLIASIPMAIIQASSAKNDLIASLFICSFFYYYLESIETEAKSNYIFAGLSLGLAILTKGNAYFLCFPIGFFIFVKFIFSQKNNQQKLSFIAKTSIILFTAVLINSSHYYRNWTVFNNPVQAEVRLKNEKITLPIVYGNMVRGYAIHLGSPIEPLNSVIDNVAKIILGDERKNPDSTIPQQVFEVKQSFFDESAGNFIHLILLTIAVLFIIFGFKFKDHSNLFITIFSITYGFLLLCVFLKWNPWLSRIQLPLFVLGCPIIAFLLSKLAERTLNLVVFLVLVSAISTLTLAVPRNYFEKPLNDVFANPRTDHYFIRHQEHAPVYLEATEFLKKQNPHEIGLNLSVDYNYYIVGDWEYPFWILLKDDFAQNPRLRHIGVENESKKLNKIVEMPEWVISTKESSIIDGVEYEEVWRKSTVRILRKKN